MVLDSGILDSGVLVRADSPEIANQASQGWIKSGLYKSQDVLLSFFRCEERFRMWSG
jgi:hypothetical protein